MNILHINTLNTGGAANACLRLHRALLKKGVDSKVLLLKKQYNANEVYAFDYWDNTPTRFSAIKKGIDYFLYDRSLRRRHLPFHYEKFSFPTTIYDITSSRYYENADIIQLNWVSGFLDESTFFQKNHKPVVWRMADLYICGGGNHYEKNFPTDSFNSYIQKNLEIRQKALSYAHTDLNIVPISNWTEKKANESKLISRFPKTMIHCGVETDVFYPHDRKAAREVLNLPQNKKIILVGAENLNTPRKGASILIEAMNKVKNDNVIITSFGRSDQADNIYNLGPIQDEKLLSILFSAVDIFITPAIEETFGQTSIEALACGTPMIAFPTGGGIDIIDSDNRNGILAKEFTAECLAEAINQALDQNFDRNWIREDTVKRFNIDDKADKYIELYKSILNK